MPDSKTTRRRVLTAALRGMSAAALCGPAKPHHLLAADATSLIWNRLPSTNSAVEKSVSEALASLPPRLVRRIADRGWRIEVVRTVVDAAPELRQRHPNGWPQASRWENADAVHLPSQRRILIATYRRNRHGEFVRTHRVAQVVRHEFGHAVDRAHGEGDRCLSDSVAYRAAHASDRAMIPAARRSALTYYGRATRACRQESFAELLAIQWGGGTEGELTDEIEQRFARCRQIVEGMLKKYS